MSRRLATVLRVAALQERLAKAEAGRAAVAVDAAAQLHVRRVEALAAARVTAGTPADLAAAVALQRVRAQAVTDALKGSVQAETDRGSALDAWTRARGRHTLLEELDARLAEERTARELAAAQRLADDLSAGRRAAR
ncbi:MAG: hypothetical protein JWM64_2034 [Frankiales bacterium]|nr:hypothetical protein [Frankiales bacterium]